MAAFLSYIYTRRLRRCRCPLLHFGEVELAQGITTAVAGNCGISMTPRPESDEAAKEYYSFEEAVILLCAISASYHFSICNTRERKGRCP